MIENLIFPIDHIILTIGLIVVIGTFLIINHWSKLKEKTRNKIIASIFGIIAIGFVVLIALLIF